jgi:hypothetical protein
MSFFEEEARSLSRAAVVTIRNIARTLQRETEAEIRRNFKPKSKTKGSFGSVKVYDLPTSSRVSLKPGYLEAFAEGKTIRGNPRLIILLPDGERLGFKRINRSNSWTSVWQRIHTQARLVGVGDGLVVVYSHRGRNYAIYKFQQATKAPKLISLQAKASSLAESIPDQIDNFMENFNGGS